MLCIILDGTFSGIICTNAIAKHDKYPIQRTGFDSFETALKYSCIPNIATSAKNISTIYLFPKVNTITTNGNPSNADVTLFISMLYTSSSANFLICAKFSSSFLIFYNCFI